MTTTTISHHCTVCGEEVDLDGHHAACEGAEITSIATAGTNLIEAAEDSVSTYLNEFGPIVSWDSEWFTAAYEFDNQNHNWAWVEYESAAKAALKRSQNADLARDPREDESQWRSV